MLYGEVSWNYLFSLQQREFNFQIFFQSKQLTLDRSISETTFLIQVYWEILNWANLCSWTCGQSEISDLKHGACAVESGQRERFWILTKRCSWRFTNKKDDIRGDWGSDYWFDHLWNAWNIDVRTVKPRRIPPSPSMSIWWTREKQLERKNKIGNCSCP